MSDLDVLIVKVIGYREFVGCDNFSLRKYTHTHGTFFSLLSLNKIKSLTHALSHVKKFCTPFILWPVALFFVHTFCTYLAFCVPLFLTKHYLAL